MRTTGRSSWAGRRSAGGEWTRGEGGLTPLELAAEQRKARTLEAIVSVFQAMAAQAPVLIVLEDAHWIDPSSLELLGLAIARLSAARVLMIVTCRPEFEPPWASETHFSSLALNRLGRRDAAAMVANVTGRKALPGEVLNQIIARTDGVPLYVEELTKTVLESGVLKEEGDGYVLTGPLPPFAIPASLQDSLMARLDRLAPVKEVAQLAAVLGRMFERDLLAAVSPLGGGDLDNALQQLVGGTAGEILLNHLFGKKAADVANLQRSVFRGINKITVAIVDDDDKLQERVDFIHHSNAVGTNALVERYIEGREFYVGVLGNTRLQVLPIWELVLDNMPDDAKKIATASVKWSTKYQKKYGIRSQEAQGLSPELQQKIQNVAKRVYRHLAITGYARIDLRLDVNDHDKVYVLEANPNAQLA